MSPYRDQPNTTLRLNLRTYRDDCPACGAGRYALTLRCYNADGGTCEKRARWFRREVCPENRSHVHGHCRVCEAVWIMEMDEDTKRRRSA